MPIIIRMVLFAFLIAVTLPAYADTTACPPALQQPAPDMVQAALHNARDHGFLWRISKDGRTSYLYGTIHVAKFAWIFPGPQVLRALRSTDTIALEMDMLDADIQADLAKGMAALHSMALPALLEQRMRQQAAALCVPYDVIANLTPELQVTTLSITAGRLLGLEASYAIDTVLAQIGHDTKKNMVSLESPEMQLRLLQMDNLQETTAFIEDSLDDLESGRTLQMLEHTAKAWADADYALMARFDEWCECLGTAPERELMKRALEQRNPALAEKIDSLHKNGKQVFAAAGSLHMFGPFGLPVLMAQRGYRVERVNFAN